MTTDAEIDAIERCLEDSEALWKDEPEPALYTGHARKQLAALVAERDRLRERVERLERSLRRCSECISIEGVEYIARTALEGKDSPCT